MFFSTLQNMIAHVHVAYAPNCATLRDAFDALKESSKALLVSQPSRHIPLTPSTTVLTLPDVSDIEGSSIVAVPHVSGAAIVATVGLQHPFSANPLSPRWFLTLLRKATGPNLSLLIPSTLDLSIGEDAPWSDDFHLMSPSPPRPSAMSLPSWTSARLRSNRVCVGVQVSITPFWSSGPSSSSFDSDLSFECFTPLTTDAAFRALQKPQLTTSGNLFPLDVPFTRKHSAAHLDLDKAIRTLSHKTSNLVEQYEKAAECAKCLCELQVDLEDEASLLFHSDKGGGIDVFAEKSDPSPSVVEPVAVTDEPTRAEGDVTEGNPSPTAIEADSADADSETVAEDDLDASSEDADADDVVAPRSLYNPTLGGATR